MEIFNSYGDTLNGAFASRHPGGVQFTFGDGRVQLISDGVDLATYQGVSAVRGDEILGIY